MLIVLLVFIIIFFFFNDTATTEIYTLSLHDALPILDRAAIRRPRPDCAGGRAAHPRSEEHTSELQSRRDLVCRLLLEKKKNKYKSETYSKIINEQLHIGGLLHFMHVLYLRPFVMFRVYDDTLRDGLHIFFFF